MARERRYLSVERPDDTAVIDFLGPHGLSVRIELKPNRRGIPEVYVVAKADDDRGTILGEFSAEVPASDDRK